MSTIDWRPPFDVQNVLKSNWFRIPTAIVGVLFAVAVTLFLTFAEISRMRAGLPKFTHKVGTRTSYMVPMSDGVELLTRVWLPRGEGPFPTVLLRSPYADFALLLSVSTCGRFVRYGYGCVYQDTRGQGGSGGDWEPFTNETQDGLDTLNWLISQDFQDGNLAMAGPSYLTSAQYAVLGAGAPPELKTVVASVFTTDINALTYENGMFRHEIFTAWSSAMRGSDTSFGSSAFKDYKEAIRYRPFKDMDTAVLGTSLPWIQGGLSSVSGNTEYWKTDDRQTVSAALENTSIPILMIGGWYDIALGPQFKDWNRLATQSKSRYVVGPWTHVGTTGELKVKNAGGGVSQWQEMLPWFEHHLKGKPLTLQPGVKFYEIGTNQWRHTEKWPVATGLKTLHLSDLDAANSCEGGSLSSAPSNGKISYVYDPDNPVPTRGGAGMLAFALPGFKGAAPAIADQSGFCERDDVLTFQTDVLEDGLMIAGDISVKLDIASSAPDTSFTVKLIEVYPDGRAVNIRDSITSLGYRYGNDTLMAYTPGSRISVTLDLWPITWRLQPGSKLRLDVSSSDFPKYHAHVNRAGPWAEQTGADLATQTVYSGKIELPVEG